MPSAEQPRRSAGARHLGDRIFGMSLQVFGLAVLAALLVIVVVCALLARPTFAKIGLLRFLGGSAWDPVADSFGALPFLYGTLVTSIVAIVVAAPIAVGIALFVTEMAPPGVRRWVASLIDLLAAIPSVVYGLWGIMVLVPLLRTTIQPALGSAFGFLPLFQGPPMGFGYLAAGLLLAIMILPTIASVTIEVMRALPGVLREGVFALGATRWEAIRMVILPGARRGILGALILGLARALGETMAVTMVIGNNPEIHASLFAGGYSLPAAIANEFAEATGDVHIGALAGLALVLLLVTLLLNAGARLLLRVTTMGARA